MSTEVEAALLADNTRKNLFSEDGSAPLALALCGGRAPPPSRLWVGIRAGNTYTLCTQQRGNTVVAFTALVFACQPRVHPSFSLRSPLVCISEMDNYFGANEEAPAKRKAESDDEANAEGNDEGGSDGGGSDPEARVSGASCSTG